MLKKEVVKYAEKNDVEYGRCMTCKHYQKLDICSNCYNGSRYCFAWKEYLENHKDEIDIREYQMAYRSKQKK